MLHFRTQGFNGCAVKYSPFFDNRLAVASAANFGLVGNGRLFILELTPNGIVPVKTYVGYESRLDSPRSTNVQADIFICDPDSPRKTPSMI
jgi:peroxin-7